MVSLEALTRRALLDSVRALGKNRNLPPDPKIVTLSNAQLQNRLRVLNGSPKVSKNVQYVNAAFTEVNKNNIQKNKRVYIIDEALQTGGVVKRVYNKDGLLRWLNASGGKSAKSPFTRVNFTRRSIMNITL